MAKRRAEDTLLHDSPAKRCHRSLCSVDLRLESMAASEPVSPPSLLALLGSRCRKRSGYFDDPELQPQTQQTLHHASAHRKTTHAGHRSPGTCVSLVQICGSLQGCRGSSGVADSNKRPREDKTSAPKPGADKYADRVNGDDKAEDSAYNSFQFWRVPLPELDLSLLEDAQTHAHPKDMPQVKEASCDEMET